MKSIQLPPKIEGALMHEPDTPLNETAFQDFLQSF